MYTHKKWFHLPTSAFLVSVAEGILQGIMHQVNQYHACLVSKSECNTVFQVSYMGGDQAHKLSEFPEQYSGDESIESTNSFLFDKNSIVETIVENNHTVTSPIPRFSHIRIVTVDSIGTMFCTCKHFERTGLPCVHQATVASMCYGYNENPSVDRIFQGFTHHDICVCWWSSFM